MHSAKAKVNIMTFSYQNLSLLGTWESLTDGFFLDACFTSISIGGATELTLIWILTSSQDLGALKTP